MTIGAKAADLAEILGGGDRRSIGRADEVAAAALADRALVAALVACVEVDDPIVRMRAADALEKVSAERPEWVAPFRRRILGPIAAVEQQEVRWHVAQILPRLRLTAVERARAARLLTAYTRDASRIVRTWALDALVQLAAVDAAIAPRARAALKRVLEEGAPSERARARSLLEKGIKARRSARSR